MGLCDHMLHLAQTAVDAGAVVDLLTGKDAYYIGNRDGSNITDISGVLYIGIYEYPELPAIKPLFEEALIILANGSVFDLMVAFEYAWRQWKCERRGSAPFSLDKRVYTALETAIGYRRIKLQAYKDVYEFGKVLPLGAWEYICNINRMISKEYNIAFLNIPSEV